VLARELELKLRIAEPAALRAALEAAGAEPLGAMLEINHIFDTPARTLYRAGQGLRLRERLALPARTALPAVLTFKGPIEDAVWKQREELESTVGDAGAAAAILAALGFERVVVYEKRRETWRVGECLAELDELPRLGWFVELEGPSRAALEAQVARLNLATVERLEETYVALAVRHGADGPGGRALRF
jgi:adenylate cyclase class 2